MLTVIDHKVVVNYRQPDLLKVHSLCLKSSVVVVVVVVVFVPLGKLGLELCTLYELALSIACVKPLPPLPYEKQNKKPHPVWCECSLQSMPVGNKRTQKRSGCSAQPVIYRTICPLIMLMTKSTGLVNILLVGRVINLFINVTQNKPFSRSY